MSKLYLIWKEFGIAPQGLLGLLQGFLESECEKVV